MFINVPVVEYKTKVKEEFDDESLELVKNVELEENGITTMYINTQHIESIIAKTRTRSTLTLAIGGEITVNKSIEEMGNLMQRVNTMQGFLPIPEGVF